MIAAAATVDHVDLVTLSRAEVDLTDPPAISAAIAGADCDLVLNCAGFTLVDKAEVEPEAARAVNALAPLAMAQACARRGAPLIHLSTDCVFDGALDRPYCETDEARPLSVYGQTKLDGEVGVLTWERSVVLRISWVFSRFGRNFVRTMLELARARDMLKVVDDQYGNPTDASALAGFILATAGRWSSAEADDPAFGLFHFTNTGTASRFALAQAAIERDPAARARLEPIAKRDFPELAARPLNGALDCGKLARVFGYTPEPWRPAVQRAADQLIDRGFEA
uniref:dTDP-4-dehydrorhamnose reductase n=1 Tax=Caulobacter sp. (strain K31) TaxID=366602 RepID=B0T585_CAUSK